MEYFYDALYLAQGAFTIWMLVDAYRRGAESYWLWIILFVPAIRAWGYFFAVKLGDFRGARDWSFLQRRPSLDELRYRAEQMPTLTNHLTLAERLVELRQYRDAIPHLDVVLAREPDLGQALYNLAVCRAEQGEPDQAIAPLEKIIARDRTWSNYAAWHLLVKVQNESDAGGKALVTCRELARIAPTMQHHCLLAECLAEEKLEDEACQLLERCLEEHQFASGYIRRRNRRWASRARQLLKQYQAG